MNALYRLSNLLEEATEHGVEQPHVAALATATPDGKPSVRSVYIESISHEGLIIFAELGSGKARQMIENPAVSICFYWPKIKQQVILEGSANLMDDASSDRLWRTRSRESQIASWASDQGDTTDERDVVARRAPAYKKRFAHQPVPRPDNWAAFQIKPDRLDIWQGGWQRMRNKQVFVRASGDDWQEQRVQP